MEKRRGLNAMEKRLLSRACDFQKRKQLIKQILEKLTSAPKISTQRSFNEGTCSSMLLKLTGTTDN